MQFNYKFSNFSLFSFFLLRSFISFIQQILNINTFTLQICTVSYFIISNLNLYLAFTVKVNEEVCTMYTYICTCKILDDFSRECNKFEIFYFIFEFCFFFFCILLRIDTHARFLRYLKLCKIRKLDFFSIY